jgi:hypothetical protein
VIATDLHNRTDMTNVQTAYFVTASSAVFCGDTSETFTGQMG